LPPVVGHKGQLQEVLLNLIQNAIDAMRTMSDGNRVMSVGTELQSGKAVVISVEDSGPGIDPKKKTAVFDAFVTTKATGMGLGLALAQMIIERHGGQLSASSAVRHWRLGEDPWKARSCPLWVKSRHQRMSASCPLYPRKRTSPPSLLAEHPSAITNDLVARA